MSIEKKQREDLQLRLTSQKEELESEFATEREELEANYQKQVDDMFFFGYRYCMKKHGIKRDVPQYPQARRKSCAASLLHESFSFCNFYCCLLFASCSPETFVYILTDINKAYIFHICTCLFLLLIILL